MFFDIIEDLCHANKIAPSALARKLNLSPSAPGSWRAGSYPKVETVMKLADYFGVSTDYLLYGPGAERSANIAGAVTKGAVVQGSHGSSVSIQNTEGSDLRDSEKELLKVFRSLDMKGQTSLLMAAYDLEEKQQVR